MFAAIGLMACPNLAVSAEVMSHVVDVESGANPYAIGVVGGQLERQPKNLAEALATVHMLDAKGYNYSLGVAQVNRANLGKYGLDSYEKAFDTCPNLAAGAQILAACYASSGGNWGKAFSCYYSGDFVTGYRDGYVQKVYDSISRGRAVDVGTGDPQAIPLKPAPKAMAVTAGTDKTQVAPSPGSPGYRVAIRSVSFYSTTSSAILASEASSQGAAAPTTAAQEPPKSVAVLPVATTARAPASLAANSASNHAAAESSIFVPQVTGPNDLPPSSVSAIPTASSQIASASRGTTHTQTARTQELGDAAFVF